MLVACTNLKFQKERGFVKFSYESHYTITVKLYMIKKGLSHVDTSERILWMVLPKVAHDFCTNA